ncbi:MAG TPA: hemerythrin domain-containing protein [Polyangiaceae bacterium]|jgi:hypothetical protein|nr:hemerythrin domain-containing protein [Polyangiaceae bacterium]
MDSSPPTIGPIEQFMVEDHVRIDRLLDAACVESGIVDADLYVRFRQALLRHIAMEEKVLLRLARDKRGGEPLPIAQKLRADHGQIAKLLVRSPTPALVTELCEVLARHNPLEEGPEGLYSICDVLAGRDAQAVVEELRAMPAVPLAKYYDGPAHTAHHTPQNGGESQS